MFLMLLKGLPPVCTAAMGYKCLFAPYIVPYVKTPIFAINSKFDASMAAGTYNSGNSEFQCPEWKATVVKCNATSVNEFGNFITASNK